MKKISKELLKRLSPEKIRTLLAKKKALMQGKEDELLTKQEKRERFIQEDTLAKRKKKRDNKDRIEELKTSREMKDAIRASLNEFQEQLAIEINEKFNTMFKSMEKQGRFYGADYKVIPWSEVRVEGLKTLGKQGWKFAFDIEEKVYLTRERFFDKEKGGKV